MRVWKSGMPQTLEHIWNPAADATAFDSEGNLYISERYGQIYRISRELEMEVHMDTPCDFSSMIISASDDFYIACLQGEVYRFVGGDPEQSVLLGDYDDAAEALLSLEFSADESAIYLTSSVTGMLYSLDPISGEFSEILPPGTLTGSPVSIAAFHH